jgi:hypothetical protein
MGKSERAEGQESLHTVLVQQGFKNNIKQGKISQNITISIFS